MKTLAIAAAALALAACTQSAAEDGSSEASIVDATNFETTERVDVDMSALVRPHCRILMGSFIFFEYQGRNFSAYGADDIGTCEERLDALRSVPVRSATFTRDRDGDSVVWKLDFGTGITFRASNSASGIADPDFERTLLKSGPVTFDLRTEISNLRCEILQGSWIRFDYRGHSFMTYGADSRPDCETRMAQFRATPLRHGSFARAEGDDSVKWTLSLDDGFELTTHQARRTSTDLTLDTPIDVTKVACRQLKGLVLQISTLGRNWFAVAPQEFSTCESLVGAWTGQSRHSGQLIVHHNDGYVSRVLHLDDGQWQFTAWSAATE